MNAPWEIKGDDIELWASRIEASALLPELLRRLLFASGVVQSLEMRADGGVHLPGWDGVVVANRAHPFCPPGVSAWELSVREQVKSKLDKDFEERVRSPPPPVSQPRLVTYVAVTARRFKQKKVWAAEKKRLGYWADVRVYDADDLSTWLAHLPTVGRWFAGKLGLPTGDLAHVLDVESFLSTWSSRTQPPLPADVVLAGRQRQQAMIVLRGWLQADHPSPLHVQSETREEAIVFAAAAMAHAPSGERERWLARAVVVESREAWRWLTSMTHGAQPILLPLYEGFEPAEAAGKGFVVVPWDASRPLQESRLVADWRIELEPIPWRPLAEKLEEMGVREVEAERLARESAGKLGALQRLCGYAELPGWTAGVDRKALFAMLWVGAWEPGNEADREVLQQLGARPEEVEALCAELSQRPEQPIRRDPERWGRDVWRWSSSADAWQALARGLTDSWLRRVATVALDVLSELDPQYDLPKDERIYAAAQGMVLRHSEALREGMAESIVRLSLSDEDLQKALGAPRGSRIAASIVARLLKPEWRLWASLSPVLPILAQAAPAEFLEAVRRSLEQADAGVSRLLAEEIVMGHSPHLGLLWALETLGWSRELMPRVADALSLLAERDPGGHLANRPLASLEDLLHAVMPQTSSPVEDRLQVLEHLMQHRPHVGWSIALKSLHQLHGGSMSPTPRPRYLKWDLPAKGQVSPGADIYRQIDGAIHLLIQSAQNKAAKWVELIEASITLPPAFSAHSRKILEVLRDRGRQISDPDAQLWNKLRESLASTARMAQLEPGVLALLSELLGVFTPQGFVARTAWLFEREFMLAGGEQDWREARKRSNKQRDDTVRELWEREDRFELLAQLATRKGDVPRLLGEAIGRAAFAGEFEVLVLEGRLDEACTPVVPGFIEARFRGTGTDYVWLKRSLRSLLSRGKADSVVHTLLLVARGRQVWKLVDELGEPVRSSYWRQIDAAYGGLDPDEFEWSVARLLEAGRAWAAAEVVYYAGDAVSVETIKGVLEAIRDNQHSAVVGRQSALSPRYLIESLFSRIDQAPGLGWQEAATLEMSFLPVLRYSERPRSRLILALEELPRFFVEMLKKVYRAEVQGDASGVEESKSSEAWARSAYALLESWTRYPGFDMPDMEREQRLHKWTNEVLELAAACGLGRAAQGEVARVLARAPGAAEDGIWPCRTAREFLKQPGMEALRTGLQIARMNMHGRQPRNLQEGGTQERALAESFRADAARLRIQWSETAAMLEMLAQEYEGLAIRADAEVRSERLRYGWEHQGEPQPPVPVRTALQESLVTSHIDSLRYLELRDIDVARLLTFDFAPRLNLLAGDNSTGKTLVLDILWWSLTGSWAHQQKVHPTHEQRDNAVPTIAVGANAQARVASYFTKEQEEWSRPAEWQFAPALTLYARVDGTFSVWEPFRKRVLDFKEDELRNGFQPDSDGNVACNGLVRDWVDWQVRQQGKFDVLRQALEVLSVDDVPLKPGLPMRVFNNDAREFPSLKMPYGRIPIVHTSAAVKRIVGLAYLLVWSWREHEDIARRLQREPARRLVILVDEIESHLHPKWQRQILPALMEVCQALSKEVAVQLFVSTHSPLVTASIETRFDESSDKVFRFRFSEEGQVQVEDFPWSKQGDASSWLVSEMFDLKQARSKEAEAAIAAAEAYMRGEPMPPFDTVEKIHEELVRVLPGQDRFWPRWVVSTRGKV